MSKVRRLVFYVDVVVEGEERVLVPEERIAYDVCRGVEKMGWYAEHATTLDVEVEE